jgi:hypothetical protein
MKLLNQNLVMSQDFATVLPEGRNLTDFGEFQLKGKSQLVRAYGLEGLG